MACTSLRANLWLIVWMLLNLVLFVASYQKYLKPQYYHLYKMLGTGLCVSRAAASIINLCSALVLLPVCKYLNSFIYQYLNKLSRSLLTFWLINLKNIHITLAVTIVIASVIHSCAHFVNAVNFSRNYNSRYQELNWAKYKGQSPTLLILTSTAGLTGIGMLVILLLMLLMSLNVVREHLFDLFWATHMLFIPFMALLILHPLSGVLKEQSNFPQNFNCSIQFVNESKHLKSFQNCLSNPTFTPMKCQGWLWVVAGAAVFSLDFTLRLGFRNNFYYTVQKADALPGGVSLITLVTKRKVIFNPGQYILLQYPRFSLLEWHPFTVTCVHMSHSHTSITLLIRKRGDWTRAACRMLSNHEHNRITLETNQVASRLLVDGPFSSPMENVLKTRVAVCIAAGIGITPFIATLNSLYTGNEVTEKLSRLHLVWVVRSRTQLAWAADLITTLHHKFWNANQPDRFQFTFYITKRNERDTIQFSPLCQNLLEQRTLLGRPKWEELFSEWTSLYFKRKVTVFICGPSTFSKNIQRTATRFNNRGCNFSCIKESFS